jgi:hypothetical protein
MKRTPLTRKAKHGLDLSRFPDSKGIYFDEVRAEVQKRYGMKVSDWDQIRVVEDPEICKRMHAMFGECWNCGRREPWNKIDAHHIAGSSHRSDELCNIAMLCGVVWNGEAESCHSNVKTSKLPQGRILFLKWKYDRQNTDWVRLTLLGRKFLDDLITDEVTR